MAKKTCGCCKKILSLMSCTCGKNFCIMHISPGCHSCPRILDKPVEKLKDTKIIATGAFSKIDKI
tara:strand:- start:223 stop:417 length:195 start_codon:yes stop_codon:yes gene_type:complete